jgi:hypothetical protein
MTTSPAKGNGQAGKAGVPDQPDVRREVLPIPDVQHVGLTTYDAKDPDTSGVSWI